MDALFAELLAADPGATLVFFQAMTRGVTERFGARVQRALGERGVPPRRQLKFLPRLPGDAFRRVLATADVVLDTVRWSGGNTSLDAIAAGVPLVAMEGRFMRGRQTAAMLRMLGLDELIADGAEGYVALARALAHDRARNAHLREAMAQRRPTLFGQGACTTAFADALLRMAADAR
jgi:CRISPR-associated protein Csy1